MLVSSSRQERAINFIINDVKKWKRQFPIYFVGNAVIVSLALLCICFGVISYFMIGGISSGDRSIYTGESGGQYFATISGIVLFGISVLSIAGRNLIKNAGTISLIIDGQTSFDRWDAEIALEIIKKMPQPIDEIEERRRNDKSYDRIFTIMLITNLIQEKEWNYIKADYLTMETEIETENAIEDLRRKRTKPSSITNLNSQIK